MRPSAAVKTFTVVLLVLVLIYFLFPIYWAIIASTKTPAQMTGSNGMWFAVPLDQLPNAIATNYSKLLGWTRGNFWRWVLNSLIYSGVSALIGTIVSVMAGYATAKFNFRGKNVAIGIIMACMLMPAALLTIPQYSIFHALKLTNTMASIIIPCCVSPFGFFLGRTYAQSSVPDELLENYSKEMLKKRESVEALVNRVIETKLANVLKEQVTLNHKAVSAEEFNQMFQ